MLKRILKLTVYFVLLVSLFSLLAFLVNKVYLKVLFNKVQSSTNLEVENLELTNEIVSESKHSGYGCNYDFKVKAVRCNTSHIQFFGSYSDQISTFNKINEHLLRKGRESSKKTTNTEILISKSYSKPGVKGKISLNLTTYGKKDDSVYIAKLLDQNNFESIYKISISTDF